MEKLELKLLNQLLKKLNYLKNEGEVVEEKSKEENDYNNAYYVLKLNSKYGEDLYLRVEIYEDSYGENERVESLQFVKPTKIVITDFEAL